MNGAFLILCYTCKHWMYGSLTHKTVICFHCGKRLSRVGHEYETFTDIDTAKKEWKKREHGDALDNPNDDLLKNLFDVLKNDDN